MEHQAARASGGYEVYTLQKSVLNIGQRPSSGPELGANLTTWPNARTVPRSRVLDRYQV